MTSQVMSQKEEHDSATWYKAQTPEGAGGNATEKNADAGPSRPIPDCQSYGYNAQLDPIPTSRPSIRVLTNKRPLPSTVPRHSVGPTSVMKRAPIKPLSPQKKTTHAPINHSPPDFAYQHRQWPFTKDDEPCVPHSHPRGTSPIWVWGERWRDEGGARRGGVVT